MIKKILLIVMILMISGCANEIPVVQENVQASDIDYFNMEEEEHENEDSNVHCGRHFPAGTPKAEKEEDHHKDDSVQCPSGLVNDPFPGDCVLYVDENNDGLCDLSQ